MELGLDREGSRDQKGKKGRKQELKIQPADNDHPDALEKATPPLTEVAPNTQASLLSCYTSPIPVPQFTLIESIAGEESEPTPYNLPNSTAPLKKAMGKVPYK